MALRPSAVGVTPQVRPIPGGHGLPFLGPLKDRLDYFWFQGPDTFFRSRATAHRSTVFRTNVPPTFPFFVSDPRVVAVLDCVSFAALFDPSLVDKTDSLIGHYVPSRAFTGGTHVSVYLDTADPAHAPVKSFVIDLLRRAARRWDSSFLGALGPVLDDAESKLNTSESSYGYLVPLQKCIFSFLCESLVGADPAVDPVVAESSFAFIDTWLALQLLPTQKIGVLQPLEEIFLHSFPYPFFLVKPGYDKLADFIAKHGQEAIDLAEREYKIPRRDAVNHLLFVLGFNAFGGFSVFFQSLLTEIGASDKAALRAELRDEVRAVLARRGDAAPTTAAVAEMPLVRSTVLEALRFNPPVPLQYGRARRDFVLQSHGAAFNVAAGELLCGYQPLTMRDPEVFQNPEEFVPARFTGFDGEKLLKYVYWSNGPETGTPSKNNKQCPAKDYVVATACVLVAELSRRFDDFECASLAFTKLVKRKEEATAVPPTDELAVES